VRIGWRKKDPMDFMKMMGKAKELQSKMAELQDELAELSASGEAGAGLVKATMDGKMLVTALTIDPSLMKPEEAEIVEDLVIAAIADAKAKVEVKVQAKTQEMMADLGLPGGLPGGIKLPFM
jgi:DNA-binding YbaB/EbfC family protein